MMLQGTNQIAPQEHMCYILIKETVALYVHFECHIEPIHYA